MYAKSLYVCTAGWADYRLHIIWSQKIFVHLQLLFCRCRHSTLKRSFVSDLLLRVLPDQVSVVCSTKTKDSGWDKWPWAGIIKPDISKVVWVWTQRPGSVAGTNCPRRTSSGLSKVVCGDHRLKIWNSSQFSFPQTLLPSCYFNSWTFQFLLRFSIPSVTVLRVNFFSLVVFQLMW